MVLHTVKRYAEIVFFLGAVFFIASGTIRLFAQDVAENDLPPGMDVRVFGQAKLVVPKDARVVEQGGLLIVEGIDKYVARNLDSMRTRLQALEIRQQELQEEISVLKNSAAGQRDPPGSGNDALPAAVDTQADANKGQ